MFEKFVADMKVCIDNVENLKADNNPNWDHIDADMYAKWSVVIDGETYGMWFDTAADMIEGVTE